ncbi:MAG: site-2 protease family protein [Dehalococcoidia bacterium]
MTSSFKLGSIGGIDIGVHYTWLLAFALISWSLASGWFPQLFPEWTSGAYWTAGIIASLLLFVSVLLHELAHSFVAVAKGLPVNGITLFIFGGVSNIGGEAKSAKDEFLIAFVGPLSSLVIGGVLLFVWVGVGPDQVESASTALAVVLTVGFMNILIGLFNLLPGYPLDGGRVLRSMIWGATNNLTRATRISATVGQAFGWILIGLGVFQILFTDNLLGGLWIAFIGWFLNGAAGASKQQHETMSAASAARVRDAMLPAPDTVNPNVSLADFVQEFVIQRGIRAAPVLENGRLAGIISLTDIRRVDSGEWATTPVAAAMTRSPIHTLGPDDGVDVALNLMTEHDINQVVVVDESGVTGMVSRDGLMRYFRLRREFGMEDVRMQR